MEAVVMETGESAAAADGPVTMEISAAAPAERSDPEQRGAAFPDRSHRMLLVIGEICSRHQLDAVRNQIAQGKKEALRSSDRAPQSFFQPDGGA